MSLCGVVCSRPMMTTHQAEPVDGFMRADHAQVTQTFSRFRALSHGAAVDQAPHRGDFISEQRRSRGMSAYATCATGPLVSSLTRPHAASTPVVYLQPTSLAVHDHDDAATSSPEQNSRPRGLSAHRVLTLPRACIGARDVDANVGVVDSTGQRSNASDENCQGRSSDDGNQLVQDVDEVACGTAVGGLNQHIIQAVVSDWTENTQTTSESARLCEKGSVRYATGTASGGAIRSTMTFFEHTIALPEKDRIMLKLDADAVAQGSMLRGTLEVYVAEPFSIAPLGLDASLSPGQRKGLCPMRVRVEGWSLQDRLYQTSVQFVVAEDVSLRKRSTKVGREQRVDGAKRGGGGLGGGGIAGDGDGDGLDDRGEHGDGDVVGDEDDDPTFAFDIGVFTHRFKYQLRTNLPLSRTEKGMNAQYRVVVTLGHLSAYSAFKIVAPKQERDKLLLKMKTPTLSMIPPPTIVVPRCSPRDLSPSTSETPTGPSVHTRIILCCDDEVFPGRPLLGYVLLFVSAAEEVELSAVFIRVEGKDCSWWLEGVEVNSHASPFLNDTIQISSEDDMGMLLPGQYVFPFSVATHPNLPASFRKGANVEFKRGISYSVSAYLQTAGGANMCRTSTHFDIAPYVNYSLLDRGYAVKFLSRFSSGTVLKEGEGSIFNRNSVSADMIEHYPIGGGGNNGSTISSSSSSSSNGKEHSLSHGLELDCAVTKALQLSDRFGLTCILDHSEQEIGTTMIVVVDLSVKGISKTPRHNALGFLIEIVEKVTQRSAGGFTNLLMSREQKKKWTVYSRRIDIEGGVPVGREASGSMGVAADAAGASRTATSLSAPNSPSVSRDTSPSLASTAKLLSLSSPNASTPALTSATTPLLTPARSHSPSLRSGSPSSSSSYVSSFEPCTTFPYHFIHTLEIPVVKTWPSVATPNQLFAVEHHLHVSLLLGGRKRLEAAKLPFFVHPQRDPIHWDPSPKVAIAGAARTGRGGEICEDQKPLLPCADLALMFNDFGMSSRRKAIEPPAPAARSASPQHVLKKPDVDMSTLIDI